MSRIVLVLCLFVLYLCISVDTVKERCPTTSTCVESDFQYTCTVNICPIGTTGRTYQTCDHGTWSQSVSTPCVRQPPSKLQYKTDILNVYVNVSFYIEASYECQFCNFTIYPPNVLPDSVKFTSNDGNFQGVFTEPVDNLAVTVIATNYLGSTNTTVYFNAQPYPHPHDMKYISNAPNFLGKVYDFIFSNQINLFSILILLLLVCIIVYGWATSHVHQLPIVYK